MNVLIAYATTEGQTEKICRFAGDSLSGSGHDVQYHNVSGLSGGLSASDFAKVIVAGSVHSGNHQKDLENYIFANRNQLNAMPSLLISVSLAAAFPENHSDAERYVDSLKQTTGWEPTDFALVAGAVKPGVYDWFEESALKEGDLAAHLNDDLNEEHEFTDWKELTNLVADFVNG